MLKNNDIIFCIKLIYICLLKLCFELSNRNQQPIILLVISLLVGAIPVPTAIFSENLVVEVYRDQIQ